MGSRTKYIIGVMALFLPVLLAAAYRRPAGQRIQQHLVYNTQLEDTNLSIDAETFSSRLPIVSIDTDGQTIPGKPEGDQRVREIENTYIRARIQIMEAEDSLNTLQSIPAVESRADIRVRGNSSRTFDKTGYLIKFISEQGEKADYDVMGMEAHSTWVLHGPYLDKTLIRNYMWYNKAGQIMEWAPDVRFCEVFVNGGYQGIYVMTEQIGIGDGRIDITKYKANTGISSYILCVDRVSVNDKEMIDNFTHYTKKIGTRVEIKYPGESKITPELERYINRDLSRFEKALYSYDYDSYRYGYQNYIDVDSFVDYFIINEVTQNTDAGYFSTYIYKDVGGKLKMAVWDFNNCCDNYFETALPLEGFTMQDRVWFYMLMKDEEFVDKIISRYRSLRKNILSEETIRNDIRQQAEYLGTAVLRNYEVWGYSFGPEYNLLEGGEERQIHSYEEAMEQYENRLILRMRWMDEHIEDLYSYSHESGNKKFNH